MTVAVDAVGPSASGADSIGSATLSWTHIATGNPVALLAGVALGTTGGNDGIFDFTITCDSVAMTPLSGPIHGNSASFGFIKMYGATGISSGAHSIVVTATGGTPSGMAGGSVSFTGAGGFGAPYTATGSGSTASVPVTSTTSGNMIAALVGDGSGGETVNGAAALQFQNDAAASSCIDHVACSTDASTGSAVTAGFTINSDYWAIIAVEVTAGGPAGPSPGPAYTASMASM